MTQYIRSAFSHNLLSEYVLKKHDATACQTKHGNNDQTNNKVYMTMGKKPSISVFRAKAPHFARWPTMKHIQFDAESNFASIPTS